MESTQGTYTAKLTDGPLEGKTITTAFLDTGDPQPRIEIPVEAGKRYLYTRGAGLEYAESAAQTGTLRPTAVEYRFLEAAFE